MKRTRVYGKRASREHDKPYPSGVDPRQVLALAGLTLTLVVELHGMV